MLKCLTSLCAGHSIADYAYGAAGVTQPSQIVRKRKFRGKEKSIQEATATLRALKTKHDQLLRVQQELLTARSKPRSVQQSLRDLVPDHLLHRLFSNRVNLHLESFLQSETIRFLIPLELTEDSVLVDCSEGFANMAGASRDNLIHGVKFSQICIRSSFNRFKMLAPILSSSCAIYVQNAPGYADNTVYDIIISTEVDAEPVPSTTPSYSWHERSNQPAKRRQLRKHMQVTLFNPRPMQLLPPSPQLTVEELEANRSVMCLSSSGSSDMDSPVQQHFTAEPFAPEPFDPLTFLDESSFPPSSPVLSWISSNELPVVPVIAPALQQQAMLIEPLHQRLDEPALSHGWMSAWGADQVAAGVPAPVVRIEGDAVRKVQTLLNRDSSRTASSLSAGSSNASQGVESEMSLDDSSATQSVVDQTANEMPVVNYYTL